VAASIRAWLSLIIAFVMIGESHAWETQANGNQ
jgi:hypothetical protein